MSTRVDTASLIPGATVVGHRGLGVLGSTIRLTTADGDHGPGILYNDVQPGDEAKEFRAFVKATPVGLALDEDGAFTYSGASTSFDYDLYVDGAKIGTATASITTASTVIDAAANWAVPVTLAVTAGLVGAATIDGAASWAVPAAWSATAALVDPAIIEVSAAWSVPVTLTVSADLVGTGVIEAAAQWAVPVALAVAAELVSTVPLSSYSSSLRTVTIYADMAGPLKSFVKQPGERLDYRFDYTRWLADCSDTIATRSIDCPAPLRIVGVVQDSGSIVALIDGGEDGKSQKLTCTITTAGGRIKEADIIINVQEV